MPLPDIGAYGSEPWIIGAEQRYALILVPGRNPHDTPARMQAANNAPAQEAGSAEHRDDAWTHPMSGGRYRQQMPIWILEVAPRTPARQLFVMPSGDRAPVP
jgi:hypothetical protein